MKKYLYLIPLVLIGLCFTPYALYKPNVNFASSPNASLTALSPSYWKLRNASAFAASVCSGSSSDGIDLQQEVATFPIAYGFPVAAYFTSDSSIEASCSGNLSAYSWLWITVDGLLIIATLALAFTVNRKKKK